MQISVSIDEESFAERLFFQLFVIARGKVARIISQHAPGPHKYKNKVAAMTDGQSGAAAPLTYCLLHREINPRRHNETRIAPNFRRKFALDVNDKPHSGATSPIIGRTHNRARVTQKELKTSERQSRSFNNGTERL